MNKHKEYLILLLGLFIFSDCISQSVEYGYQAQPVDLQIVSGDKSQVSGYSCFHVGGHFVWGATPVRADS